MGVRSIAGPIEPRALRFLLARHGISQRKFARLIGVHERTVRRWTNDKTGPLNPPISTLIRVMLIHPDVLRDAAASTAVGTTTV